MGSRILVSPVQTVIYIFLVVVGILGNATVVGIIGTGLFREQGRGRSSDMILVNMAFSNLMVSITRNTLLVISDLGVEVGGRRIRIRLKPMLVSQCKYQR